MTSNHPVVVALGGNALADDEANSGYPELAAACRAMAQASRCGLLVTHGNGPQIGELSLADRGQPDRSLDALSAETEGMLGYRIEQELQRQLPEESALATLLTWVEVSADDPAFSHPTKPVGPGLRRADADRLRDEVGWHFSESGDAVRRLVASPRPLRIIQLPAIRALLAAGIHVICSGGGGIPVTRKSDGSLGGIDAVVDKDRTSALLALEADARLLVLATDVNGVFRDWNNGRNDKLDEARPGELKSLSLPAGTMGAKVEAACDFVEASGRTAVIGSLAELGGLIAGNAGTRIHTAAEK